MSKKVLVLDPEKCTGCMSCVLMCSFSHEKAFSVSRARIRVLWLEELALHLPTMCMHCSTPLCEEVCPSGAISKDPETGATVFDHTVCVGCKMCMMVCPFGAPVFDTKRMAMICCDLCGGDPACVKTCAFEALQFLDLEEAVVRRRREALAKVSRALEKLI